MRRRMDKVCAKHTQTRVLVVRIKGRSAVPVFSVAFEGGGLLGIGAHALSWQASSVPLPAGARHAKNKVNLYCKGKQ